MALTPQEMLKRMVDKLSEKTGRTFEAWVEVAKASGIDTHKALTTHLKTEHGLNHNEAQWIAWGVTDPGRIDQYDKPADLVEDLYSGKKAHLRPIYDRLMALGLGLGSDTDSNVCKTYTSLSRATQFAIVNPRTNKLVDLELRWPEDVEAPDRLERFKTSNPKFTHRLRIGAVDEIDDAVVEALRTAYEANR